MLGSGHMLIVPVNIQTDTTKTLPSPLRWRVVKNELHLLPATCGSGKPNVGYPD